MDCRVCSVSCRVHCYSLPQGSLSNVYVRRPECLALQGVTWQLISSKAAILRQYGARILTLGATRVHWALLRTLPFGTEGSLLRWEPQPHAAAPCTPYTSLLGASFKPDMAGRACILSGNRVAKVQTTSRGRVAMGLCWSKKQEEQEARSKKSKKQKASRSSAPGHHATPRPRASSTLRSKHRRRSTRGCWLRLYITHVTIGDA